MQAVVAVLVMAARVCLVWRRRALCEALQCLVLYFGRHPLSDRGWRKMLALTLAIFALRCVPPVPIMYASTGGVGADYLRLVSYSIRTLATFSKSLLGLCPVALVGALLEDLRHDVTLLLRAPHAATDTPGSLLFTRRQQRDLDLDLEEGAERWRSLRVRQQLLHDLLAVLQPALQFYQLIFVSGTACDAILHFSTCYVAYMQGQEGQEGQEGELKRVAVLHLACAVAALVFLAVTFGVLEWPRNEVRSQWFIYTSGRPVRASNSCRSSFQFFGSILRYAILITRVSPLLVTSARYSRALKRDSLL